MENEHSSRGVKAPSDRRSKKDRRVTVSAWVRDRRERTDRRQPGDRRGHYYNQVNPDDNFLYEVFVWLIDSTKGEWSCGANEHEPEDSPVTCRIRFDNETDLNAFIAWVSEWEDRHR